MINSVQIIYLRHYIDLYDILENYQIESKKITFWEIVELSSKKMGIHGIRKKVFKENKNFYPKGTAVKHESFFMFKKYLLIYIRSRFHFQMKSNSDENIYMESNIEQEIKSKIFQKFLKKLTDTTKELSIKTRENMPSILMIRLFLLIENVEEINKKQRLILLERKRRKFSTLNITITLNNIFASVTNEQTKKTKYAVPLRSAGQFGLKISKVSTKFYLEEFIEGYFKFIELFFKKKVQEILDKAEKKKKKKKLKAITFRKKLALNLNCPPKYRTKILRLFIDYISNGLTQKRNIFINIRAAKNFNGCRGKKLIRKKRLKIKYLNKHYL